MDKEPKAEQIAAAGVMVALGVDQVTIKLEHEVALRTKVMYTHRNEDGSVTLRLEEEES